MKRTARHIILLHFVFLFFNSTIIAQLMGVKVFAITTEGSSPRIFVLKKHSAGYFLLGTAAGLYRFDGMKFASYPFRDTPSSRAITAVAEDHAHQVWLGFQSGEIGRLVNGSVQLLKTDEGYPKVAITSIAEDGNGIVYFSTAGEGVYFFRRNRFYNINTDDGLSDNYVYAIMYSRPHILAGTDNGLNTIKITNNRKQVHSYTSRNTLPDNIVRCLAPARSYTGGNSNQPCWVGMQDKGVGLYAGERKNYRAVPGTREWPFGQVNAILDQPRQLWVATEDKGVILINYADTDYHEISSLNQTATSFNKAGNLLNDDEGNTWFTSNNLLIKTSGTQFQNIIPYTAGLYPQIHALLCCRDGTVWINYNNGLKKFSLVAGRWMVKDYPLPAVNKNVDITCLYEDMFGHIWIGTMGKGIIMLDAATDRFRSLQEDELLQDGSILSVSGRDKQVWISSLAGATQCLLQTENADIDKPLQFKNFNKVSGIGSNYVYSIMVDSRNRVWFATDGKGITVDDNGVFTNYNEKDGLKSKVIYNLCEDMQGNIWLSALNAGVYKFDGKRFTNYSFEQGLNDTITSLAVDKLGNIVAVSKKGVNIIETKTNNIYYMDASHGIAELNEDLNCIGKADDGSLFLSSSAGIIRYNPMYTSLQPRIMLENVQLFLKDIDTLKQKSFSYDENNISFTFSAISFSNADKIRYRYQLLGLSNEWVVTSDAKVNFPKLAAGNYTFKVRSSVNNNFDNSGEVAYSFIIKKPLWLQWWFITLFCCLVAASALYWYIRVRERRVQRIDRLEKEQIQSQFETLKSQVNPHFLFNSFNTLISVIEETPGKAVEYVEHLSDLYRKIVTYRDKDVIFLKEEIDLINDYFFIQKKRFGNNLVLINKLRDSDLNEYMIAPLTLQLLVENAVKHNSICADTPLKVELFIEGKCLVVKNNLNSKSTVEGGAGMGLQNIQKRYKLLSPETVSIEKADGWFCVKVPLLKHQ